VTVRIGSLDVPTDEDELQPLMDTVQSPFATPIRAHQPGWVVSATPSALPVEDEPADEDLAD
jgi:hypothetical protein